MEQEKQHIEYSLYKKVAAGEELAFRELFLLHQDHVFILALSLLKSRHRAEDVVQEVFLKVWLNRATLPSILQFRAYLSTITRHHIYNSFRKMANEELFLHHLAQEGSKSDAPIALEQLDLQQLQQALFEATASLTNQQKKIFELSRIEGLSHENIAQTLNMKRVTVKKHITDALKTIKKRLKTHHHIKILMLINVCFKIF